MREMELERERAWHEREMEMDAMQMENEREQMRLEIERERLEMQQEIAAERETMRCACIRGLGWGVGWSLLISPADPSLLTRERKRRFVA